jgi:hypothetical protein
MGYWNTSLLKNKPEGVLIVGIRNIATIAVGMPLG